MKQKQSCFKYKQKGGLNMKIEIKKSITNALFFIVLLVFGIVLFSFLIPAHTYKRMLNILSDILYWITLPF